VVSTSFHNAASDAGGDEDDEALEAMKALLGHAMSPAQFLHRRPQIRLLQNPRDPLDRKPLPLHDNTSVSPDLILSQNSHHGWSDIYRGPVTCTEKPSGTLGSAPSGPGTIFTGLPLGFSGSVGTGDGRSEGLIWRLTPGAATAPTLRCPYGLPRLAR
jgi:hypothetical protein